MSNSSFNPVKGSFYILMNIEQIINSWQVLSNPAIRPATWNQLLTSSWFSILKVSHHHHQHKHPLPHFDLNFTKGTSLWHAWLPSTVARWGVDRGGNYFFKAFFKELTPFLTFQKRWHLFLGLWGPLIVPSFVHLSVRAKNLNHLKSLINHIGIMPDSSYEILP